MPIFQDDLDSALEDDDLLQQQVLREHHGLDSNYQQPALPTSIPIPITPNRSRRASEESIRTELCEGPVPDSPQLDRLITLSFQESPSPRVTSDRAELIERLKRGESPTWIPNRHRDAIIHHENTQQAPTSTEPDAALLATPALLPPIDLPEVRDFEKQGQDHERQREGLSIERPRSALHSGDFTLHESPPPHIADSVPPQPIVRDAPFTPPRQPWIATSPPRGFSPFPFGADALSESYQLKRRSLSTSFSSSVSSSFVYKPPTSPLVQSETNEDEVLGQVSRALPRPQYRQNSMSHVFGTAQPARSPSQRHSPYQAHQPRKSLSGNPASSLQGSSPRTPYTARSRRPSLGSDSSSLPHASMVGSYEESILRGRMSTTPSKPLEFLAQIGVLGLGKCKSSLKCPPHVSLQFPAVFYSYANSSHGRSRAEDGPSPYVGQIDLENGLPNPEEVRTAKRRQNTRVAEGHSDVVDVEMTDRDGTGDAPSRGASRPLRPNKRRSGSPRAPPGGSYRIPEKGQIQIVIKNPNKTAVKLFLIPYDLDGMEPGRKTFIRQRSYSAGPIIDNLPAGSDSEQFRQPILRYLVHLHICSPSQGRYYLYKNIRLVFANRVPDGKEKLRTETTWPEPRFSPYKPIRTMLPAAVVQSGPGATLAAEKAFRRRSSGFSFAPHGQWLSGDEPVPDLRPGMTDASSAFSFADSVGPISHLPLPSLFHHARGVSEVSDSTDNTTTTDLQSPGCLPARVSRGGRPTGEDVEDDANQKYEKLSKGDVGYGGNAFAPSPYGRYGSAEGLLSQSLKGLGVRTADASEHANYDAMQD